MSHFGQSLVHRFRCMPVLYMNCEQITQIECSELQIDVVALLEYIIKKFSPELPLQIICTSIFDKESPYDN